MSKAKRFWLLAAALFLNGGAIAVTGFILWLAFPDGGGGRGNLVRDLTFWGVTKHNWIAVHDWLSITLIALTAIHIIVHWKWIVRVAASFFRAAPKFTPQVPDRAPIG